MPCFVSPDIIYACNTCKYMYDVYNACTYIISWPRFASLKRTGLLLLLLGLVGDGTHGLATGKTTGTASRNETDLLMCVAHGRYSRQRRGAGGQEEGRRMFEEEEREKMTRWGEEMQYTKRESNQKKIEGERNQKSEGISRHLSSTLRQRCFIFVSVKHLCLCRETKGFHVS